VRLRARDLPRAQADGATGAQRLVGRIAAGARYLLIGLVLFGLALLLLEVHLVAGRAGFARR
jgi:hypothetical protein